MRIIYCLVQFKNEYTLIALIGREVKKKVDFTSKMQSSCRTLPQDVADQPPAPLKKKPQT